MSREKVNYTASPFGTQLVSNTYNVFITLKTIHLTSTETNEKIEVSIPVTQFFQGDYGRVFWINNESYFFLTWGEDVVFNPFSNVSQEGNFVKSIAQFYGASEQSYFSPDWNRSIHQPHVWILYDLENNREIRRPNLIQNSPIAWSPDSQHFVGIQRDNLTLFDRDGNRVDALYTIPETQALRFETIYWSPDNRYLSVMVNTTSPPFERTLYLIDFVDRQIIDTCTEGFSATWPSNSQQMFFMGRGRVRVLDMNLWQQYTVAYHSGEIIGWRAN